MHKATSFDGTYQKVYVFDGIIAIAESANLSLDSWKKASEQKEQIEVYTELDKVKRLNNMYISKHFLRLRNHPVFRVTDGVVESHELFWQWTSDALFPPLLE